MLFVTVSPVVFRRVLCRLLFSLDTAELFPFFVLLVPALPIFFCWSSYCKTRRFARSVVVHDTSRTRRSCAATSLVLYFMVDAFELCGAETPHT